MLSAKYIITSITLISTLVTAMSSSFLAIKFATPIVLVFPPNGPIHGFDIVLNSILRFESVDNDKIWIIAAGVRVEKGSTLDINSNDVT